MPLVLDKDPRKTEVVTRDGREAKIVFVCLGWILAIFKGPTNTGWVSQWYKDSGMCCIDTSSRDIINKPRTVRVYGYLHVREEGWQNFYSVKATLPDHVQGVVATINLAEKIGEVVVGTGLDAEDTQ